MKLIDADRLCEDLLNRWNIADTRKEELIRQVMADIVTPIVISQPTVEPQKWIPISVKLPEKRQDVIVTVNDGMIYTDTDEWIGTGFFAYGHNVVAWQSLPDPWKGEEE